MGKKILVNSGGSVKGAWEAGVLKAVFEKGFKPDVIYGISVGNLNGAFLTAMASKNAGNPDAWNELGEQLHQFWITNITNPKSIIRKRTFGKLGNLFSILTNKFNGLFRTTPLDSLIDRTIYPEMFATSPIPFYSGCVNITSGKIEYYHSKKDPEHIINSIKASKAIPFIMEGFTFKSIFTGNEGFFLDGGIRDVIPLSPVFNDYPDVDEIVIVSVHPNEILPVKNDKDNRNFMKLAERVMDIVTNETATNDVLLACTINAILQCENIPEAYKKYRKAKIHHIHPRSQNEVQIDLETFTTKEIQQLYKNGYQKGIKDFMFKPDGNYTKEEYAIAEPPADK